MVVGSPFHPNHNRISPHLQCQESALVAREVTHMGPWWLLPLDSHTYLKGLWRNDSETALGWLVQNSINDGEWTRDSCSLLAMGSSPVSRK